MHIPIYSGEEHRSIVEMYINMCKNFAEEVSTQTRYKNYLEVIDLIIEYSNGYGQGTQESGSFYDWIMIMPINISVATNGFFAGLETKRNSTVIKAYRKVLNEMVFDVTDKIDELKLKHE